MSATQRQARCIDKLASSIERMIAVQMLAYPDHWSPADKREAAQLHLFGRAPKLES